MKRSARSKAAHSPHQGPEKKVLCVCTDGLLRSPTMAHMLHATYGYNTRSAGIRESVALQSVDDVLIEWADEIVCTDPTVRDRLLAIYKVPENKTIVTLNIADRYGYMELYLRRLIRTQYTEWLDNHGKRIYRTK